MRHVAAFFRYGFVEAKGADAIAFVVMMAVFGVALLGAADWVGLF